MRALGLLPSLVLLAAALPAQARVPELAPMQRKVAPVDPFTERDPKVLARAGYVSLGPFPFGAGHTTADIEALLGTEDLCWIETQHFRIGCALSPLELRGEDEWVLRTKRDLKRLAARLPRVKADAKMLDPWLRAHLVALRVEDLYAEIAGSLVRRDSPVGPNLGMAEKFTVLLVHQCASHARYTKAYQDRPMPDPIRYHDLAFGSMYFGGAEETAGGLFKDDLALHTHLVFNVAQNLYQCYRGYSHDVPAWIGTGLAHWHARQISPKFPTYDRKHDEDKDPRSPFWDWGTRVRGLVKNEAFESLESLMSRMTPGEFGLENHIHAWAFADFLMTTRKEAMMRFLHGMKEPFHDRLRVPTRIELLSRQEETLKKSFGLDARRLDKTWRAHVLGQPSLK